MVVGGGGFEALGVTVIDWMNLPKTLKEGGMNP